MAGRKGMKWGRRKAEVRTGRRAGGRGRAASSSGYRERPVNHRALANAIGRGFLS